MSRTITNVTLILSYTMFILLFASLPVFAVGIQGQATTLVFKPNLVSEYSYTLINAGHIESFLSGDLTEYATIIDPDQNGGPRMIKVVVRLPEQLPAGEYNLFVGGKEVADAQQGAMGGIAAIRTRIPILVLYPGTYPIFSSMTVKDINVNEKTNVSIGVSNYGTEKINSVYSIVDIFDPENHTITTLRSAPSSIESNSGANLESVFDSSLYSLKPGIYRAVGRIVSDGVEINFTREKEFLIGSMLINILDSTPEVYFNATNRYTITIASDWSGDIKDVYAYIYTPNKKTLKTPNVDLNKPVVNTAKATAVLETYWETLGLETGEYNLTVELHYSNKITSQSVKVKIIEGVAPKIELPKQFQVIGFSDNKVVLMNISIPLTVFLMSILAIIVMFNVYYLLLRKKSDASPEGNANSSRSGDVVRPPKL